MASTALPSSSACTRLKIAPSLNRPHRPQNERKNIHFAANCPWKSLHHKFPESNRLICAHAVSNEKPQGGTGASTSDASSGESINEIKRAVLRSVSNTNRGKETTSKQRKEILKVIEELERLNSVKNPVDSDLLSGSWALLYTAPVDEETADKYAGTEEGPFLSRMKPLALGTVKQTRSLQIIDTASGTVQNIADFSFFGLDGSLCINAKAVKDSSPEKVRIYVTFESFDLKIGNQRIATLPLGFIKPKGWVDTTYLDEQMRVGRGDKGSIFVAVRTKIV